MKLTLAVIMLSLTITGGLAQSRADYATKEHYDKLKNRATKHLLIINLQAISL